MHATHTTTRPADPHGSVAGASADRHESRAGASADGHESRAGASADGHESRAGTPADRHESRAGAPADRHGWAAGARRAARPAYAALAAVLLGAALFVLLSQDTGWWQFFAFGAAPDIALLAGIGSGLEKGRLHPRAVPLYNALHRFAGPLALAVVVVAASLPAGYLVGAIAWGLHIAVDRVAGYGLRTPDGFQRN